MLRPSAPNTSTARVGLRYGIYTGIGMALYTTILRFIWPNAPLDIQFATVAILAFGITQGMLGFRKEQEKMTFLQGWGVGSILSGVAGLMFGIITLLIILLFTPAASNVYREASVYFLITVFLTTLVGGVISLVAALFYKQNGAN